VNLRHALTLAAMVAAPSVAARAQQPMFSARVEAVRVDVLVTDRENGPPLLGLKPDDFEILDNGVPQQVDLVSFEEIPLNVILALDLSESVEGDRLHHLQSASGALIAGLERDDQAALVGFSHVVTLGAALTSDHGRVREALNGTFASGETALIDATFAGIMIGESDVGRGLLIVFSDGVDTASFLTENQVLDAAKRSDIVVYGVAVQSRVKPAFFKELTSATGGRFYEIEKTAGLENVFLQVLEEFRHRYLVSYTPRGVEPTGWHRLTVGVRGRRATVRARPGYLAGSVPTPVDSPPREQ
jgi:Ca-activated chloride channel family protein